ncbi:MAG: M13 family peptidase, partial [Bacteroidales bacterium]|nr:M13 family peptidase [Bacteroidales bacterium]
TEAIADMGGMKCMLAIAAQKDDFDYDAFFRQYATLWRMQGSYPYLVTLVAQDTHPMRYLRINNTLAQFDEFVDFYGITEGDGMYIAPEARVAVW